MAPTMEPCLLCGAPEVPEGSGRVLCDECEAGQEAEACAALYPPERREQVIMAALMDPNPCAKCDKAPRDHCPGCLACPGDPHRPDTGMI